MNETARIQAEGLQFLREYRSAFTTRGDGSKWPRWEQTWLNATRYFRGLLRLGSNTATDIAAMRSWVDNAYYQRARRALDQL